MKKKVLSLVVIAAIALVAGLSISENNNEIKISDLTLENIEALANGESSGDCSRLCPSSGYMCIINFTNGTSISCPGRWS